MSYLLLLITSFLWGSIGIFILGIDISSTQTAFYRLLFACISLISIYAFSKNKTNISIIKENFLKLLFAGGFLGANWVALFEAYKLSSVSITTVVYSVSPILIIAISPIIYKEKLTVQKIIGIACAFLGMCAVSLSVGVGDVSLLGVMVAFLGASMYSASCLINKSIKGISGFNMAMIEMIMALIVVSVYTFLINKESLEIASGKYMINLIIIGVVHTGIAYGIYMSVIQKVQIQTIAVFAFLEPFFALVLSALILKERMSDIQIIGAVCIIGGAMFAEFFKPKRIKWKIAKK